MPQLLEGLLELRWLALPAAPGNGWPALQQCRQRSVTAARHSFARLCAGFLLPTMPLAAPLLSASQGQLGLLSRAPGRAS